MTTMKQLVKLKEAEATAEGRPKRTRKRQRKDWKREERKRKRNYGNSYITRKGRSLQRNNLAISIANAGNIALIK